MTPRRDRIWLTALVLLALAGGVAVQIHERGRPAPLDADDEIHALELVRSVRLGEGMVFGSGGTSSG